MNKDNQGQFKNINYMFHNKMEMGGNNMMGMGGNKMMGMGGNNMMGIGANNMMGMGGNNMMRMYGNNMMEIYGNNIVNLHNMFMNWISQERYLNRMNSINRNNNHTNTYDRPPIRIIERGEKNIHLKVDDVM
jgi:hypothetical protein